MEEGGDVMERTEEGEDAVTGERNGRMEEGGEGRDGCMHGMMQSIHRLLNRAIQV